MKTPTPTPTLLAVLCSLALAGGAFAAEPEDPKAEPAETHHAGGDAMQHDRTAHPVEGDDAHAHDGMQGGHMMQNCKMESTGDADQDFALHMRHHHLMGVQMARKELAAGDDAGMKAMAQRIVDAQTAEVAELDRWLAANGVNPDRNLMACGMHAGMGNAGMAHAMPVFADLDSNGDGFIDHSELDDTHPIHQHFPIIDANADGRIDTAELEKHRAQMRAGSDAPLLMSAPHPAMTGTPTFATMDGNGDGFLGHGEIPDGHMLHEHFDAADADKDGKLSQAEVDAHHAQMQAPMKH